VRHPGGQQLGFVAREIEKQFPELVLRNNSGYLAAADGTMPAVAIGAIKEQQAVIESQDERIARLEAAIQKLTDNSGGSAALGMLGTNGK
jgi:hypothetical protein